MTNPFLFLSTRRNATEAIFQIRFTSRKNAYQEAKGRYMPTNGCSTNETNCFPFPHNRRNGKRLSISLSTFRKVRRHRQALVRCSKSTSRSVPLDKFSTRTATTSRFRWGRPTQTRRCATCHRLSPSRPSKTAHSPFRHSRMRSKEPLARRLHPRWRSTLPS